MSILEGMKDEKLELEILGLESKLRSICIYNSGRFHIKPDAIVNTEMGKGATGEPFIKKELESSKGRKYTYTIHLGGKMISGVRRESTSRIVEAYKSEDGMSVASRSRFMICNTKRHGRHIYKELIPIVKKAI